MAAAKLVVIKIEVIKAKIPVEEPKQEFPVFQFKKTLIIKDILKNMSSDNLA